MRTIFFGTPAIAVPSLEALASISEVVGVVCQPDKRAGRGLELKEPEVKTRALKLGIEVIQPVKVRTGELANWVRAKDADVALVIAYGRILPPDVLAGPRRGCLNLHASILPKYRGAAPITWCIVRGETETGVALMQMDEGMDTGPVFTQHRIPIGSDTTADDLAKDIAALAARVVTMDLERAVRGEISATPQDHAAATMAPILEKENGRIDFSKGAKEVHDHIRGMTSWPGAFTTANGKRFLVLSSKVARLEGDDAPGTVVFADKSGIEVACGRGAIAILRGQMEGKKALSAQELAAGRTIQAGMKLG